MTYSITARDPETGQLGVAVQSHFFGVGPVCAWAKPGAGAVATQAMAQTSYGPLGLDRMAAGEPASDALAALLAEDDGRETRQVAMVDAAGRVASHTGSRCIAFAGHICGDGWSVQANMMRREGVPEAMADAFTSVTGDLAERMLAALDAAEAAGGDVRGKQSAALRVVPDQGEPWAWVFDVRVDDHVDPLPELRRLVRVHRAYLGDDSCLDALGANPELLFWKAIALAAAGRVVEATALLDESYAADPGWRLLLERLPASGILDAETVAQLLQPRRPTPPTSPRLTQRAV